jgi:ankyrin repeat protein
MILSFACLASSCQQRELPGWKIEYFDNSPVAALARAVFDDNGKTIDEMLSDKSIDVDYPEPVNGNTLLMYAIVYNKRNAIKALLDHRANPNKSDKMSRSSAMSIAVENTGVSGLSERCDTTVIDMLIEHGGNVNYKQKFQDEADSAFIDQSERYLLDLAAEQGCTNVVKLLVERGANINARLGQIGNTAIFAAASQDNLEIVKYLVIEKKANVPDVFFTRPASGNVPEEKLTLSEFLLEANYEKGSHEEKLRSEILQYLTANGKK